VATPPVASVAAQPAAVDPFQRVCFMDAFGNPVPRERARIAVAREFDDHGKLISLITELIRA
jgi:hypothetical protein